MTFFVMPFGAWAETLADALADAYKHSGLLDQNRALLRAADEDVAVAVSALRPVLSYSMSSTYSASGNPAGNHLSGNIALTAGLVVFDFGRNRLAVDAAKENVLSLRDALVGIEQQVLLRAVSAYMNVRRDAEFVALRENNVRLITQELRAARDRFEVGEITRTDVSIAEARLAAARASLAAQQGGLEVSREEFKAAVGRYPGNLAAPSGLPVTARSLEEARNAALQNHPDLKRVQHEVAAAEINIRLAEAARRPTVNLNASAGTTDRGTDTSSIGLSVSGPIYQGGQISALYRKAVAGRDAVRAGLHLTRQAVSQGAGNAWANLSVALASIEATERQIRAARSAYRGVREEAQLGARTTLDVLDAEQELLDANASRISSESDAYIAAYQLLSAMGYLTVDHLGLGIQTYDPADYYNAVSNAPAGASSVQGERLDELLRSLGRD